MIKRLILIGTMVVTLGTSALAQPSFVQQTALAGSATSPGTVIFPVTSPSATWRILNVNWRSDTNVAVLSFSGGSTAYTVQSNNVTLTGVNQVLNTTNGLSGGATLVLQHNGVCWASTVSSWSGPTNIVLAAGGWGTNTVIGDSVFLMDTPISQPLGVGTNAINGEALYVAALSGRPVMVKVSPTQWTNGVSAVAKLD